MVRARRHSHVFAANFGHSHLAEPLTEEQLQEKERLIAQGFEDWSRRDFQQFVKALEAHGWYAGFTISPLLI